ncbi:MAG: hypothetical protein IPM16_10745 [Chloroflexi bacterium]|nr:hypothetical protein [Chloroflexota bacterium]
MSATAALFRRDGAPVDQAELQRMVDAMRRRGPDGQRVWSDGCVGLGHGALFSTHEAERENQPCSLDGKVWIAADARIDGWDDLRRALEAKGRQVPRDVTDADLILHAYAVWGEACVEHLIGEFAFVIWDGSRQQMVCVRDHMGNRSLYVHMTDSLFAVASDVGALLTVTGIPNRINEGRIADYLVEYLEGIDFTTTFFDGIERLPPATCRVVTRDRCRDRKYWAQNPKRVIRFNRDAEYVEAFLDVFTKAVSDRLRAPERVGSMLSGGIDSSSIVGVARRLLQKRGLPPLPTFSAISEDETDVETQVIRAALTIDHLEPHLLKPSGLAELYPEMEPLYTETHDLFDTQMPIPQAMYVMARRRGLKVVLDGVAGDLVTTLGGNHIRFLLRSGRIWDAIIEAQGHGRLYHRFPESPWKILFTSAKATVAPEWYGRWRMRTSRTLRAEAARKEAFIRPEFADRINVVERMRRYDEHHVFSRTQREDHVRRLTQPYLTAALERYDRVAAFYGIEARHPYHDVRLMEFCVALDWSLKDRRGWSKALIRRAMEPYLPDDVRWATPRQNLSSEFWRSRNQAVAADESSVMTRDHQLALARYMDVDRVRTVCARGWHVESDSDRWKLFALLSWPCFLQNRPGPNIADVTVLDEITTG